MIVKKDFLGISFTDVDEEYILEYIVKKVKEKVRKFYVVTPNPEILVLANNDFRYKKVLNSANLALADGIGIILGSKLLGNKINHKIAGVDLLENLCKRVAKQPITVSFLGGRPKIAERTAECLQKRYPSLKVAFAVSELDELRSLRQFDDLQPSNLTPNTSSNIASYRSNNWLHGDSRSSRVKAPRSFEIENLKLKIPQTDILFVAFGSPKQEFWIADNLEKLPIRVAIGVGGAFDFVSGEVKRAPKWMRQAGLEWLFRLIIQPWRLKRQFSLLIFLFLVIKEKLRI